MLKTRNNNLTYLPNQQNLHDKYNRKSIYNENGSAIELKNYIDNSNNTTNLANK